jgi:mono/diheme cytochrome c family protein
MRFLIGMGLLGLTLGCDGKDGATDSGGGEDSGDAGGEVSADVQAVFEGNCMPCHGGASPQSGLALDEGESYDATVGVTSGSNTYISCGDAAGSWVFTRMEDGSMPPGDDVVSADDLATVADWIDGGCQ